uniref:Uncharacterized protein n=1 Tax=Strigamia maritima TaxID=126957 RepID=T1JG68_STRMM
MYPGIEFFVIMQCLRNMLVFLSTFLTVNAFQPFFLTPPTWPGHMPYHPHHWFPPYVTGHRRLEPIYPHWNYYFDGVQHDDQRAPPQSTTYPPLRPTNPKVVLELPVLNTDPFVPQVYTTSTSTTSTTPFPLRLSIFNATRSPYVVTVETKQEEPTTSTQSNIYAIFLVYLTLCDSPIFCAAVEMDKTELVILPQSVIHVEESVLCPVPRDLESAAYLTYHVVKRFIKTDLIL